MRVKVAKLRKLYYCFLRDCFLESFLEIIKFLLQQNIIQVVIFIYLWMDSKFIYMAIENNSHLSTSQSFGVIPIKKRKIAQQS